MEEWNGVPVPVASEREWSATFTHHPNRAGMRTAAALSNRTVSFCGLLRKTHTQVTKFPHMRLPLTSLILI